MNYSKDNKLEISIEDSLQAMATVINDLINYCEEVHDACFRDTLHEVEILKEIAEKQFILKKIIKRGVKVKEKLKVMISQPMNGKSLDEIKMKRSEVEKYLKEKGFTVVNTLFNDSIVTKDKCNEALYMLSKSLMEMSKCDLVYFCKEWDKNRGCKIEHEAALSYGIDTLYEL